jgi:hypothetical protein
VTFGFQACPAPSLAAVQTYTGLPARTEAVIKSRMKIG